MACKEGHFLRMTLRVVMKSKMRLKKKYLQCLIKPKKKNWGILKLHLKGSAAEGSTYKPITFDFNNGDSINIACFHYSDAPEDDHLKISMSSKEFSKYKMHKAEPANN